MFKRFKNKGGDRKSTGTDWLTTRFTNANLPAAPSTPKVEEQQPRAPSYQHADKQTGPVDTTAEERHKKDEQIREEKGKAKADKEQPITQLEKAERTAVAGEKYSGPSTAPAVRVPTTYNRFWKLELEYDMEDIIQSRVSFWTPNCLAMFAVLEASGKYVYDNATLRKRHPDYLDYAVASYYSIIFYIQILRAQKAAGQLHGKDRSFINRFLDKYKPEELVISSIMEPFFATIVSTLPKDTKYDWIVPQYSTDILRNTFIDTVVHGQQGACYIQPMVPYMLRILRTAISGATITAAQADTATYFDNQDRYITHSIPANPNTTPMFGVNFSTGVDPTDEKNSFFSMAGVRYPFYADIGTLAAAAPKMRRSKFFLYPYSTGAHAGENVDRPAGAPARGRSQGDLDDWMDMGKFDNTEWFGELLRQASLHARFFEGMTNLSAIPVTSGNEALILCKFKKLQDRAIRVNLPIHLNQGAGAVRNPEWYPNTFTNYMGEFTTTRAGVSREEVLQAFTNGTNGHIDVTYTQGGQDYRVGDGPHFHTGPYWDNVENSSEKFHNAGIAGKDMFRGWDTMFQEDAALEKPQGY